MGQSGQEKTEQPTAKKRRDARKEGNIFQSRDVATVVILAGIFFGIRIWLPFIYGQMKNYMTWVIDGAARSSEDMLSASLVFVTLSVFLKCALPLLLLALLLGIVAHGVQTRFNVSFKSIRPKWNRLNPLSGIKRLFSMKNGSRVGEKLHQDNTAAGIALQHTEAGSAAHGINDRYESCSICGLYDENDL